MGNSFTSLQQKHNRLKARIHGFRIPLSPTGQKIMGVVYCSIPVIGGYYLMDWVTSLESTKNIPERPVSPTDAKINQRQKVLLQQILDKANPDKK